MYHFRSMPVGLEAVVPCRHMLAVSDTFLRSSARKGRRGLLLAIALAGCAGWSSVAQAAESSWLAAAPMTEARYGHSATLLSNHLVLMTGGFGHKAWLKIAELHDESTDSWRTTTPMHGNRMAHTATRLAIGKVLVAGGLDDIVGALANAELYDPATETWTLAGSPAERVALHSACCIDSTFAESGTDQLLQNLQLLVSEN